MVAQQIPIDPEAIAGGGDEARDASSFEVTPDVAYRRLAIANVVFIGPSGAGDRNWVLIDAGVPGLGHLIRSAADERFGAGARPSAIVMTHGHFDHVGALEDLAEMWDAPVYAHALEAPYLNGRAAYPPGDASVGGGLMTVLSPLFPTRPVDLGARLRILPDDGEVPPLPGWRWIHTPGHSVGHVSLWREADGLLVSGDAFITVASESAYATAVQEPEIHGPPKYFTVDWPAAEASVRKLAALGPRTVVPGHGRPLDGADLRDGLARLAAEFPRVAVPDEGRYVEAPARAEDGSAYR